MLWFLAEHRLVLQSQVAALLGAPPHSVQRRLHSLAASGYVSRFRGFGAARCYRIRSRGLAAIGSQLGAPEENTGMYRHDVGVAWLWVAARRGKFGPLADVIGERRLRSHDMILPEEPYAIRLGGYEHDGQQRRHYPDLLLIDRHRRRLALELELSPKKRTRREEILAGYGADRQVDGVLYLVEDNVHGRAIARALTRSASEMGVADRVHLRAVTPIEAIDGAAGRSGTPQARISARAPSR